ncbi:MAG: hypothetical protein IKS20_08360 [Victivallales bacterium]|nr:hypothetical protein [Victivallales bacterium]
MGWLDWVLIWVPLLIVVYFGLKSQKYVKSVADFLSAGRIAGRYLICVAGAEAGQGLISVVATMEMYYRSGFAISFWSTLTAPVGMILGLVGFCTYRYRETKVMTMGQFFEIRYGKAFRVVAAVIQSFSGIVNYAIFPAVGGRFLVYFLGLPITFQFLGITWSSYAVVMFIFLAVALFIACLGGQVTIMVTDCVQGLLSYPMFAIIVSYFLWRFSWSEEMAPALMCRAPGESFLNPYDTYNLRDFNIFYATCGIVSMFTSRMSWAGAAGYSCAAKNAHESKMGGLLGSWRQGFGIMMYILIAVVAFTYLNHKDFAEGAREVRKELSAKTIDDVIGTRKDHLDTTGDIDETLNKYLRAELKRRFNLIPARTDFPDAPVKPSLKEPQRKNYTDWETYDKDMTTYKSVMAKHKADVDAFHKAWVDPYPQSVRDFVAEAVNAQKLPDSIKDQAKWREDHKNALMKKAQTFGTIYNQMLISVAVRRMLPMGLTGIFAAIMIFLMLSTDTTYMHSWGSIVIQDFVLPLRKTPFTPIGQINALRWSIGGVCLFAFLFSLFFAQVDYILMFFAITGAIWSGAGIVITLGLYWKRGTTAGAFTSLLLGATIATSCMIGQNVWADKLYPFLVNHQGLYQAVDSICKFVTAHLGPIIVWNLNPHKFPINSTEIGFMCNILCVISYTVVSLCTCREPFNMDRMLHRGIYAVGGPKVAPKKEDLSHLSLPARIGHFLNKNFIGIDENYTKGDKILAYSVFAYSFGYSFVTLFLLPVIWNFFSPWEIQWWSTYFFIKNLVVSVIIAVISTFWFGICGTRDLMQLYKDLAAKEVDVLDDGRVMGNMSVADIEAMKKAEAAQKNKPEEKK